jgi:hypothetical protein
MYNLFHKAGSPFSCLSGALLWLAYTAVVLGPCVVSVHSPSFGKYDPSQSQFTEALPADSIALGGNQIRKVGTASTPDPMGCGKNAFYFSHPGRPYVFAWRTTSSGLNGTAQQKAPAVPLRIRLCQLLI